MKTYEITAYTAGGQLVKREQVYATSAVHAKMLFQDGMSDQENYLTASVECTDEFTDEELKTMEDEK